MSKTLRIKRMPVDQFNENIIDLHRFNEKEYI